MTFREAIRKALSDEMSADKNVVLFGEDVGVYGGCFKVTEGLWKDHPDQVIDTPVSEEGFTGMAVGAAMMGLRPVVEIMYADFYTLIFDPIVNHASKTHFTTLDAARVHGQFVKAQQAELEREEREKYALNEPEPIGPETSSIQFKDGYYQLHCPGRSSYRQACRHL